MLSSLPQGKAELSLHQHSSGWPGLDHISPPLCSTVSTKSSTVAHTQARLDAVFWPATVPWGSQRSYLSPRQALMLSAEMVYLCMWP